MKQTILGSGGVIGIELAKILPVYTDNIRLVSRNPKQVLGNEELIKADLTNLEETINTVKGSGIVYLTVGLTYSTKVWEEQWLIIMQNVIHACKIYKAKLVFLDNVYAYGKVSGWMTEETPYSPCSKKGTVRHQVNLLLEKSIANNEIEAVIARSANFYGKGATHSFAMPMIFDKYKIGKTVSWLIDKTQPHAMTYTHDIAKALALLGNNERCYNQTWHLPTDKNVLTGEEFMNEVAKIYKVAPKQSVISSLMMAIAAWVSPGIKETKEMAYQFNSPYLFDSSKFEKHFFKATTYSEGISETVES